MRTIGLEWFNLSLRLLLLLLLLQAQVMGSGARLTSTVHNCGICGGELKDFSHVGEEVSPTAACLLVSSVLKLGSADANGSHVPATAGSNHTCKCRGV